MADGLLLSMSTGSATYYYHYNGHGDVVQLTDQSGNVVASYTYDAWGNILSSSGAMADSRKIFTILSNRIDTHGI
ncbi:MAG: hypothetical protein ACM3MK_14390 [Chitinophagales bacterium]